MAYDAGKIEASLDVDRTPFQRALDAARREARKFESEKFKATIGADTTQGDAKILDFNRKLQQVSGKRSATVDIDNARGLVKLADFSTRLDEMSTKIRAARITLDDDRAKEKLDALDLQLRRVGLITSEPRVSLKGIARAELQLEALQLRLDALNRPRATGGAGGGGGALGALSTLGGHAPGAMALGLAAAAPMAIPLAGVGLGAAASLVTPFTAGAAGAAIFGFAAKSSIEKVTKASEQLEKIQAKYNAATTNKERQKALIEEARLWASLDPKQQQAVKNVTGLKDAWHGFQKQLEPQVFGLLATGATIAEKGLKLLAPAAHAVGFELGLLAHELSDALDSPFYKKFATFLGDESSRAVAAFGHTIGSLGDAFAHLMVAFAPLGHDFEDIMTRLAGKFDRWSQGEGPAKFVAWVEKNGPTVGKAIEGLGKALEGIGKGLSPIGQVELKALTPVLNFIGKLGDEHPAVITALGVALLGIGTGMKAIQLAGSIGTAINSIKVLSAAAPGLTGALGGAGAALSAFGVSFAATYEILQHTPLGKYVTDAGVAVAKFLGMFPDGNPYNLLTPSDSVPSSGQFKGYVFGPKGYFTPDGKEHSWADAPPELAGEKAKWTAPPKPGQPGFVGPVGPPSSHGGPVKIRASGGPFAPGDLFRAGDGGRPELVRVDPSGGGYVYPTVAEGLNRATAGAASGHGGPVDVHDFSIYKLAQALADAIAARVPTTINVGHVDRAQGAAIAMAR